MMYIALVFYLCLVGMIGWSAVRHRREGWISGLILAILLATVPLWVMAGIHLYQGLMVE